MWWGNQMGTLRALYLDAAATNRWTQLDSLNTLSRVWPYRPTKAATTQRLIMQGLKSQGPEFTAAIAEAIDSVLVSYGVN